MLKHEPATQHGKANLQVHIGHQGGRRGAAESHDQQEVARTAAILKRDGRSDLFFDYCLPIANRLKQSSAVAKWLSEEKSDAVKLVRDYVDTVDKTFAAAAAGSGEGEATTAERAATVQAFDKLREELQRKPDHPVHRLLKAFYQEERRKNVRLAPTYW